MAVAFASYTTTNSGSGSDPDIQVSKPTSTASGDLLIGHLGLYLNPQPVVTVPSGFTADFTEDTYNRWVGHGSHKVAGGSEPSTYTWSVDSDSRLVAVMGRFTGADTTNPLNAVGTPNTSGSSDSTPATCPSITTDVDGCLILYMIMKRNNSTTITTPGDVTQAWNELSSSNTYNPHIYAAYEIQSTAGVVAARNFTLSGASPWTANTIAIAPAGGGGGGTILPFMNHYLAG